MRWFLYCFLILNLQVLFSTLSAQPGTNLYHTRDAFKAGTLDGASVTTDSLGFKTVVTDTADSIFSQVFTQKDMKGGGSLYLHAKNDTLKATTADRKLWMLLYRGESFHDTTRASLFRGWETKFLMSWSAGENHDQGVALVDSTWFSKNMTTKWKYLFTEAKADCTMLYLDQFHYQVAK